MGAEAMTQKTLRSLTEDALVDYFVDIALKQYEANKILDSATYNGLFDQKAAVQLELKSRNGDQRRALVSILSHDNPQVRLNAAWATLAVAPIRHGARWKKSHL